MKNVQTLLIILKKADDKKVTLKCRTQEITNVNQI